MIRRLAAAGLVLALSACATGQKPSASEPVAVPGNGDIARADLPPTHRKKSPYAPAKEDLSKRGNYTRGGLYAPGVKDSVPDDPLHDVDQIPEPDVVAEPRSRYGNRSSYTVLGKRYHVLDSAEGYVEQGEASYYGNKFHGRRTSNMEVYDMYAMTAAHKSLPLPSFARVTNLDNGKSVVVRVNDRGPFHGGRIIDLSYAAAVKLGYRNKGVARVEVRALTPGDNARQTYDAVAASPPAATPAAREAEKTATLVSESAMVLPEGVRIATGKPAKLSNGAPASAVATSTAMDKLVGLLPAAQAAEPVTTTAAGPTASASVPPASTAASNPAASQPPPVVPGREWRFDMRQDGKAMTAAEFDAWMKSRRATVATGKPTKLTPAPVAASQAPPPESSQVAAAEPPPPTPQAAASSVAASAPPGDGAVTLQVASFANATNASHALAMLRGADIASARLMDAHVNGQTVYRLRVGPVDPATAPELAARVVGLGFGQPQRVRD